MKVTVKKTVDLDGNWIIVEMEDGRKRHFSYDAAVTGSEQKAIERAMKIAKDIENPPGEEIIYQTPEADEKHTVGINMATIDEQ